MSVYLVTTNGVQHMRKHTSKASAVKVAEGMRKAAEDMSGRNVITVTTEARGKEVYRWETPETATQETVEIQGEYVEAPDAFGHMAEQEAARVIADGGCVGLCAVGTGCGHCDEQYGPVAPQTDAESVQEESESMDETVKVIAVVQNVPGMAGETHYHTPECRDVKREMRRWGQQESDTYTLDASSVAFLLSDFEDGGRGSNYAEENTPEWWTVVVENAGMESVKIMSCLRDKLPVGFTTQGAPILMSGGFITGIGDVPDAPEEKEERESAGDAEFYTPGASEEINALSGSMDDLSTRSTGTTHHSVDTEGQSWVRFDHVLSVGDVVQSTDSSARGIFKVYALIPGLPVVYVDPCDGRTPFPMGATKLYAL